MSSPDEDVEQEETCFRINVEKYSDKSIPDYLGAQLGISIESWVRLEWALRSGLAGAISSALALTENIAENFPARVLIPIIAVIGTQRTIGTTLLFGVNLLKASVTSLMVASLWGLIIPKHASTFWIGLVLNCTLLHIMLQSLPTKRLGLALQSVSLWFWWKGTGLNPDVDWYFPLELLKTLSLAYCCSLAASFMCCPFPSFSSMLFKDRFHKAISYCNETYNLITRTASLLKCDSCCHDLIIAVDMHLGNVGKLVAKLTMMEEELSIEQLFYKSNCSHRSDLKILTKKYKSLAAMRDSLPGISKVREENNSYHCKQIGYMGVSLHSITSNKSFVEGVTRSREDLFSSPDGAQLVKLHGAYKVLTKYIRLFRDEVPITPEETNSKKSILWEWWLQLRTLPTLLQVREALRASSALAGSTALSLALDLEPAFWASLTVAFVLSSSTSGSVSTSLNRITGTLCGSMFSYVVLRTTDRSLIVGLSFSLWSVLCGFIKAGNPKYAYGGVVGSLTSAIIFFGYDSETGGSILGHSTIEELAFSRIQQTLLACTVYILLMHFYRPVKSSILVRKELTKSTLLLKKLLKRSDGLSSVDTTKVNQLSQSVVAMNVMLAEITEEPNVDIGCQKERRLIAVSEMKHVLVVMESITTILERLSYPLPDQFSSVAKQFSLHHPISDCYQQASKLFNILADVLKTAHRPSQEIATSVSHLETAADTLKRAFDESLTSHVVQNKVPILQTDEAESIHTYVFDVEVLCSEVVKFSKAIRSYNIKQEAGVVVLV